MALMVMNTAMKVSPGKDRDKLRATMVMNIMIDFAVGLVPFLGDVADALYKCNTRNAVALEKMLNKRVKASEQKAGVHTIEDDDDNHSQVYIEDTSPPSYIAAHDGRGSRTQAPVEVQRPAKTKSTTRGGWFSGQREREADLEAGEPPLLPRK